MKTCKIGFEINGKVGKQEKVYISGSNQQLGCWQVPKAMPTVLNSQRKTWISKADIYVANRESFQFKLFFTNLKDEFLRWETFEGNRLVKAEWHKAEISVQIDNPAYEINQVQKYPHTLVTCGSHRHRVKSASPLSKMGEDSLTFDKANRLSQDCADKMAEEKHSTLKAISPDCDVYGKQQKFQITLNEVMVGSGSRQGDILSSHDELVLNESSDSELGKIDAVNYLQAEKGLIEMMESAKSSRLQLIEDIGSKALDHFMKENNFYFVTAMLPIQVTKLEDGKYQVNDHFLSSSQKYYYIRKFMHKNHKFPWIGCYVFEGNYEEKMQLRTFLFENHGFWPVFITKLEYESSYSKVFKEYLSKIFSVSSTKLFEEITDPGFYDIEKHWNLFEGVNRSMAQAICELNRMYGSSKKTFIVINKLMCILIPQHLLKLKQKFNMCYYFHAVFPHLNHLRKSPKFRRIFMSLFACDLIMFTSNLQAFNFLKACKDAFLLEVEYEKAASIRLNYKGRYIFISIMAFGIEKSLVPKTKNVLSKEKLINEFSEMLKQRVFIFTNEHEDLNACMFKLNIIDHLLKTRPSLAPQVYILFCITCDLNERETLALRTIEQTINQQAGMEVIQLVIQQNLKKYKRLAYYQLADIYFEVSYQERVILYSLEYKLLRRENGKLMTDDLSSSVDALNYNVIKENPMRIEKFCSKFKDLILDVIKDKESTPRKKLSKQIDSSDNMLPLLDPETSPLYSLDSWFDYLIADLKHAAGHQKVANLQFTENKTHDFELIATKEEYQPIAINQIYKDVLMESGVLVIDFDGLFMNNETVLSLLHFMPQKSASTKLFNLIKGVIWKQFTKFIEFLRLFEKNEKLIIILFSVREKKLFNTLFEGIELANVILIVESGCYHKRLTRGHDAFTLVLANVSEDWILAVKPSIQNYTERYNLFSTRYHNNFIELSIVQKECEITKGRTL